MYALLELDETVPEKKITPLEDVEISDEKTCANLRSACIIVEESIQRIQRERILFALGVFLLVLLLFSFNGNALSNGYLYAIFLLLKNLLSIIGISICVWFICLGKPVERNALSAMQNTMRSTIACIAFFILNRVSFSMSNRSINVEEFSILTHVLL